MTTPPQPPTADLSSEDFERMLGKNPHDGYSEHQLVRLTVLWTPLGLLGIMGAKTPLNLPRPEDTTAGGAE